MQSIDAAKHGAFAMSLYFSHFHPLKLLKEQEEFTTEYVHLYITEIS